MQRILMTLLVAATMLSATPQNPPPMGVIEGRIVRIGTAEPISNGLVTLTPSGGPSLSPEAAVALAAQSENLRRNAMIAGTARENTQAAVASFLDRNGTPSTTPIFVLTDDAGRFTFKDVPPGRYSVRGEREGYMAPRVNETYQSGFVKNISLERDKKLEPIEMALIPPGVLSGRVFDPQGQPAANARPNGEFEIRDVRPGSYDLIATSVDPATRQPLYSKIPVEVRNGDVTGLSLVVSQGATVNGQVEIRGAQASLD